MVRIEGLKLAPGQDEQLLRGKAARLLRVPEGDILSLQVLRRAIDAREELHFVYTAAVTLRRRKVHPQPPGLASHPRQAGGLCLGPAPRKRPLHPPHRGLGPAEGL